MRYRLFTSESVAAGHPDKICDQISDAIVDAALDGDRRSRVAVETLVTTNKVILAGEITSKSKINFKKEAQKTIKDIGYTNGHYNFSHKSPITVLIHKQSPEISVGVDTGGAGDQGMMFGYATNESSSFMPLPISLAHRLTERLDQVRKEKIITYLKPDGKSEVTVSYENGTPKRVERVVLAVPHKKEVKKRPIKRGLVYVCCKTSPGRI